MISSNGNSGPHDHEVSDRARRQFNSRKRPRGDRVLCLVANDLRSRLYLSGISQWSTEGQLAEAIGNKVFQGAEEGVRSNIIKT